MAKHLHDNAHIVAPLQAPRAEGQLVALCCAAPGHICLYPNCLLRSAFTLHSILPFPCGPQSLFQQVLVFRKTPSP